VLTGGSSWRLAFIGEPRNNDLRVVVVEAIPESDMTESKLGPAYRVVPTASSRAFEINWYHYVAYQVRNESYCRPDGEFDFSVGELQSRTTSAFLSHVMSRTFATHDFPGALTHWALATDWQILDVVCVELPDIRALDAAEVQRHVSGLAAAPSAVGT